MAANTETETQTQQHDADKNGNAIKRMFSEAVEQVQSRVKQLEAAFKSSVDDLQGKLKDAGEDSKKRLETLRGQLKLDKIDELLARFGVKERAHELVEEGVKLGEEAAEKLGLAKLADVDAVKELVDGFTKTLDSLK
ncbi:MAG: hypothetical protein KC561_21870, partial [Myxococcales bacterium]|nr:hypothetical protein [Myxococcales bacterium]